MAEVGKQGSGYIGWSEEIGVELLKPLLLAEAGVKFVNKRLRCGIEAPATSHKDRRDSRYFLSRTCLTIASIIDLWYESVSISRTIKPFFTM